MNVNENSFGTFDNDNNISFNGSDNGNLEIGSFDTEEETNENEVEVSNEGDSSSGDIDLSEILIRLENLEDQNETLISSISVIEDNSQYFATIKDATGVLTSSFVFALIIALIILTYNVLNNFFK